MLKETENYNTAATPRIQTLSSEPVALKFRNALELLMVLDEPLRTGKAKLHQWQVEELLYHSRPFSKENPDKHALVAANGSGKDRFVIAPMIMFLMLCKIWHRTVTTSSSALQLQTQTENYVRYLSDRADTLFGKVMNIKQRNISCEASKSDTLLFATDEPGKAEGFHPITFDSELCLIMNEAKSIPEDIFDALNRCTGYSRWLEISSPGKTSGHLYEVAKLAQDGQSRWTFRRVTSYDCPHKSPQEINEDKLFYGEHSAYFRSKHLAEFTSEDEQVVMDLEFVKRCLNQPPEENLTCVPLRAGLDLAAGGDECVFSVFQGNTQIGLETFHQKDTTLTARLCCEQLFQKYGFTKDNCHNIRADDGGVGKAIVDMIWEKGWSISRVLNQSRAVNTGMFGNRGAEMYFGIAKLIGGKFLRLLPDIKQRDQLSTRYYKQSGNQGKIILESKADARAHGHPSPDRGDGAVLANAGYSPEDFIGVVNKAEPLKKVSQQDLLDYMDRQNFDIAHPIARITGTPLTIGKMRYIVDEYYQGMN